MNGTDAFLDHLTRHIQSNKAATYFINGIPGAGKTYLLDAVRANLPNRVRQTAIFGPYALLPNLDAYFKAAAEELVAKGYLDALPELENYSGSLELFWRWVYEHGQFPRGHTLVVLLDVDMSGSPESWGGYFSSFRGLVAAQKMQDMSFRLHHVIAGYWNHAELEDYYVRNANISFPYTTSMNYCWWEGISAEEAISLLPDQPHRRLRGQLLYELTQGHTATLQDLLQSVQAREGTMRNLLAAAQQVAKRGESSQRLVRLWQKLPPECFEALRDLVNFRRLPQSSHPFWEYLYNAGLVRNTGQMVQIRSWVVELILRLNWSKLTTVSPPTTDADHVVPEIYTFNREAYQLIYEIETELRNVITFYLCQVNDGHEPSLQGWVIRENRNGLAEDLSTRALVFRANSESIVHDQIGHPLIAFTQLGDLNELIKEIADVIRSDSLRSLSAVTQDLMKLRNRVMHSQLVGDGTLDSLYQTREQIYQEVAKLYQGK